MEKRCDWMRVIDKNNIEYDFDSILYDIVDNTLLITTRTERYMFFLDNIIGIRYR